MINWLRSMGNKRAELIVALGKGYKHNVSPTFLANY
jgi:hypothetical protein